MKFIIKVLMVYFLLYTYGCSDSSTNNSGGGILGGGDVTFTMDGQGDINSYTFGFKPSVDAKISSVIVSLPAQNFYDTLINNNAGYVYSKDTSYALNVYQGVDQGQAWNFAFNGNIVSNNSSYNVNSGFTIP